MSEGYTMQQVGTRLGISPRTVETHVAKLYRKLGVRTRVQAVSKAAQLGLLDLGQPARHLLASVPWRGADSSSGRRATDPVGAPHSIQRRRIEWHDAPRMHSPPPGAASA